MTGALAASPWAIWGIAAAATAGVILRPFSWPEWVWAVAGAALLLLLGLLPWQAGLTAVGKGLDVYLFLLGMVLLSELARREGLFDHLAARTARLAGGSANRLFALVYGVGTIVTVFMSNDATAVVLTPAVIAATKAARVRDPLPYLFICALIANAASFVLPISNPANLVVFASHMPPLGQWLARFALPAAASILATFAVLWLTQRSALRDGIESDIAVPDLPASGRRTGYGIAVTAAALLAASAFDTQLGWPTFACGALTAAAVLGAKREAPWGALRDISWGVLPLVAGLFVLVEGLDRSGVLKLLSGTLHRFAEQSATWTGWGAGALIALACNLLNNLPAGLIAGSAVEASHAPPEVAGAILIGVDLGPNLSVTGSLATILWLTALRRDGQDVGAWRFLKLGALVMPPALVLALAALHFST